MKSFRIFSTQKWMYYDLTLLPLHFPLCLPYVFLLLLFFPRLPPFLLLLTQTVLLFLSLFCLLPLPLHFLLYLCVSLKLFFISASLWRPIEGSSFAPPLCCAFCALLSDFQNSPLRCQSSQMDRISLVRSLSSHFQHGQGNRNPSLPLRHLCFHLSRLLPFRLPPLPLSSHLHTRRVWIFGSCC